MLRPRDQKLLKYSSAQMVNKSGDVCIKSRIDWPRSHRKNPAFPARH